MEKSLILLTILIFLSLATTAADFTVETLDSDGDRLNVEYEVVLDGETIESSDGSLETELETAEQYKLIAEPEEGPKTTFYDFSISEDFDFRPRIFEKELPEGEEFLTHADKFYFNNQSIDFDTAKLTLEREQPDRIAQCMDFEGLECQEWGLNSVSDFESSYDSENEVFSYNVSEFSGYTTGENAALPSLENIQIFNVTDEESQRTGGELVDEGLNKTFNLNQSSSEEYRFSFEVKNQGSDDWVLTSSDSIVHEGLNQSWELDTAEDIYYELDEIKEGGDFSEGEVSWNTGNGGTLEPEQQLNANYIVNISQASTNTFEQSFEVLTTEDTQDSDNHELDVTVLGIIEAFVENPIDGSVVQKNREFNFTGFIDCIGGDCGTLDLEPRSNDSGQQESFNEDIFEVTEMRTDNCDDLKQDERCEIDWSVNATGEDGSTHLLDFEASSNYDIESQSSNRTQITVEEILLLDMGWNVIDFGLLDPGDSERPAQDNEQGYNLTVDEESNTVDHLWIKGSDLISEEESRYSIGIGNMSYSIEGNNEPETIGSSFTRVDEDLDPGEILSFNYWLDVPQGIIRGAYTGSITFKANTTEG